MPDSIASPTCPNCKGRYSPNRSNQKFCSPKCRMAWCRHSLSSWCSGSEHVVVRYLGEAAEDVEQGVVCASYNVG